MLLESEQNTYQLELLLENDGISWRVLEQETSGFFATSESSQKESQSMKSPAAYSYDQLSLWPSGNNLNKDV